MNELDKKGLEATKKLMQLQGFDVIGEQDGHVVALEGDCLVFTSVKTSVDCLHEMEKCSRREREKFEKAMAKFLTCFEQADIPVRLDKCELWVISDDRAITRYTRNYL